MNNLTQPQKALLLEDFSFRYVTNSQNSSTSCNSAESAFSIGPLNWSVEEGDFVVLSGKTGCGKTTLLRCCKTEIAPVGTSSGTLKIFGKESLSLAESAQAVGFVFQNPENQAICSEVWHELAFGLENLGVSPSEMRRRVAEVSHFFGIESWLHKNPADLSGGQKQIVNVASVLALNPKVLILDEPTAQLDPISESNLLHVLFRLNRELGITIIAATHHVEAMIPYAKTLARLEGGIVISESLQEKRFEPRKVITRFGSSGRKSHETSDTIKSTRESKNNKIQETVIQVRDVCVSYERKGPLVLHGCDLNIQKGTIHALVGGNGCGKTTLLKTIAGLLKPVRGSVKNTLASNQAYIPQDPKTLFVRDSVMEELLEWKKSCGYSEQDVKNMLRRFDLEKTSSLHPYDLSGGQQQALAFCKVLLTRPALLLLDEPTKGLDASFKLRIAQILRQEVQHGMTLVMCSHDLSFVSKVADTATMLFDGEVACSEPTQVFFEGNFFYRPFEDEFSILCEKEKSPNIKDE